MAPRALLPILLLCALLLLAQGGTRSRHTNGKPNPEKSLEILSCEKRPNEEECSTHCSYFQECEAGETCCVSFCGNVCMNHK